MPASISAAAASSSAAALAYHDANSRASQSMATGLGIGIGLGYPIIAAASVAATLFFCAHRRKREPASQPTSSNRIENPIYQPVGIVQDGSEEGKPSDERSRKDTGQ